MLLSPRSILSLGILGLSCVAAQADTIDTFNFSGSFSAGQAAFLGAPTGTVTIDTTTGTVDAIDLSFSDYGVYAGSTTQEAPFFNPGSEIEIAASWYANNPRQSSVALEDLFLPVSSLIGYTGGAICSIDTPCAGAISTADYLTRSGSFLSGELTLESNSPTGTSDFAAGNGISQNTAAATPEPSGLVLLGTGLLGGAAALCRKRARDEDKASSRVQTSAA